MESLIIKFENDSIANSNLAIIMDWDSTLGPLTNDSIFD